MIPIERPPAPAFMTDPNGRWMKETEDAIEHYKDVNADSYDFKLYNDPAVKNELKKVFVKCAYCESSYAAVSDGDVEHFRPKGKVKEKTPQTPGYYWLANNWDNLFLACQHCNQRRKHILYGEEKLEGYGKLDQFPLDPEIHRLIKPDLLATEEPARLLINPCLDDPTIDLAYEKREAVIVPLTPKGKKSVEVFVLQRPYLVQERKKQLIVLFRQMERVKRELVRLNNDTSAQQKADFELELKDLMAFTKDEVPYAGMSRFFVKEFLHENNIDV
jgi:hypothetical protein